MTPRLSCRCIMAAVCLSATLLGGGCSMSFPIASLVPGADDVTGSIRPVAGLTSDDEDRRRAKAALSTALDPQGAGTAVDWDNPASGNKGSFVAVGHAYPEDSRICRAFQETTRQGDGVRTITGKACALSAGDWTIMSATSGKKT